MLAKWPLTDMLEDECGLLGRRFSFPPRFGDEGLFILKQKCWRGVGVEQQLAKRVTLRPGDRGTRLVVCSIFSV